MSRFLCVWIHPRGHGREHKVEKSLGKCISSNGHFPVEVSWESLSKTQNTAEAVYIISGFGHASGLKIKNLDR